MGGTLQPSIPGFVLHRRLSRGEGPTEVWEGTAGSGRRSAIKVLIPVRATPDQVVRFQREGALLERLGAHPGVVGLEARLPDPPALVLSWASGGCLRDRIHPNGYDAPAVPLDAETIRHVGIDLCEALEWLHGSGVYHRDVKPGNVLLGDGDRAILADFGIAAHGNPPRSLPEGWIEEDAGTLGYAAPELLRDPAAAGPAIDVYGVAATLYEAATGRLPHPMATGASERAHRWRLAAGEPPVPLAEVGWRGPARVRDAIEGGLAADPSARHPSAAALRQALG